MEAMKLDSFMPASEGWPWPWKNSKITNYTYCFHDGRVMVATGIDDWKWIDPTIFIGRNHLDNEEIFPLGDALAYGFELPNVGCTPGAIQIGQFVDSIRALSNEDRHFKKGLSWNFGSKAEYEYWLQDYWVEVCIMSDKLSIALSDDAATEPVSKEEFPKFLNQMIAAANVMNGEDLQLAATEPLRRLAFLVQSMAKYPKNTDWAFRLSGKGFRPDSVP